MTSKEFSESGPLYRYFTYSKRDFTIRYLHSIGRVRKNKQGRGRGYEIDSQEAGAILLALSCCESPRELEDYFEQYAKVECSRGLNLFSFIAHVLSSPEMAKEIRSIRINRNDVEAHVEFVGGKELLFYDRLAVGPTDWKVKNDLTWDRQTLYFLAQNLQENEPATGELVEDEAEYMYRLTENWKEG
jgi:hypothetical protein